MNPLIESAKWLISESTRFVSPPAIAVEWMLAALVLVLCGTGRGTTGHRFLAPAGRLRAFFHRLANRRRTAILICGILPVAVRLSLLSVMPVPEPSIHDEFSHLLLADTLAHGRLANPPHALYRHFESIHIIQQPTYSSMYPPAQGTFLALGEVVFREPWAGVVISVGLMCMAVCWMMQGWLPPAWAFYGSLIVGLKIGIVGLWMNSYMGGAAPAIGGALLVGSLPRLRHEPGGKILPGVFLGLGMVILMNSRPFDGALLSFAALLYLAPPLLKNKRLAVLGPAAVMLACGLLFTGYYNWRVTGNPARMGYQVNRDTYGWPENLAFLPAKKVVLRDPVMEAMYLKEIARRDNYHHVDKLLDNLLTRLLDNWIYFIGPLLTMPLLFLPRVWRDRRTRPLVYFTAAILALNLFQLVLYPYHLAPLVATMFAMVAQGMRHLYVRLGPVRGAICVILLPACLVAVEAMKQNAGNLNLQLTYWENAAESHGDTRAYITEWLSRRPAKQLVMVRYSSSHNVNQEWVYNGADLDSGKVVWAREVDPASDAELLKYFHDREVWLLRADWLPPRVVRYPAPGANLPDVTRSSGLTSPGGDPAP